ncbi:hypothetical protein CC1G_15374 [Coprinopsis cinerea okayama7|uniref:Uncharacterized protein n=1 Tax=Coprinopsis cinerea (strain Okayama-7 / 130 / ATCC MYA-4618 / FGSC 9003) TaxID=240176 RepID=D6RQK5_COPC7|nr:hypothetical protein CC1G_15374 [Coprinopsis cinerea okayama7\|eukprot:XP_002910096.1 hypothetical protein CC1G_15374 [Coprinopsis cinerea okayama7\
MSPEASKDAMRTTLAAMACTAAANALITILISSRLLIANRSLSKVLPGRSVRACSRAVTILVESAVPLSLCGLISVGIIEHVLSAPGVSIKYVAAGSIFDGLYSSFAALSPQMIIFRVTTGRSFMRHEETKVDSQRMRSLPFSQPLAFNHGTTPAGLEKANLKEAEFNEAKGTSAV